MNNRIVIKSQELMQGAGVFYKSSQDLRRKMWWKNMKLKLIIGGIISVIIIIIVAVCVSVSEQNKNTTSNQK